ncbi:hypothetical protein SEA_ABBA_17 [Arthrobacter phage Abba]|uniref:Uncharacterized protein n=1 Tax=Arthrobacter phage Abba TaxID=2713256 RepID=A0A6G8R2E2_9CAUD|nr:hypothetical protein HYQ28_gp17 [Arthrobacter phage Abba]QIN94346.1 hypothetical protein SEA_ABBA_17 [Arthrobacter phage Abba]
MSSKLGLDPALLLFETKPDANIVRIAAAKVIAEDEKRADESARNKR